MLLSIMRPVITAASILSLFGLFVLLVDCKSTDHVTSKSSQNRRASSSSSSSSPVVYNLNQFAVRVRGGRLQAKHLADKFNLRLVKQIFPDSNYFLFEQEYIDEHEKISHNAQFAQYLREGKFNSNNNSDTAARRKQPQQKRLKRSVDVSEIRKLKSEPSVEWVQQQVPLSRKKRDFMDYYSNEELNEVVNVDDSSAKLNDPMWSKLWYINTQQEKLKNSMRIKEAWQQGYTGKDIVVTILDDGLEWDHPDIIKNYDSKASLDINDNDNDPRPRYDRYNYNKHGTRCAGEIAAEANNKVCSVGVAFNSRIGGIRMLDGEVTDLVEATALSYNRDYIDIYSASWGPDDDGKTVDGPGFLALKAIEDGIKYGRRGLGSIYVWASGNGGKDDDNCNCDGYTNSIYTISVSSATQNGNIPWYSEACSSTIASTFSSGSYEEKQIITTDLRKSCTEAHTGTSASAPLAAGIIALTLEANSELTWRDVQHIIVETSRPENLSSTDWQLNGANRRVSHSFGYGMMDALGMIDLAKKWTSVPPQRKCVIESSKSGHHQKPILIPRGDRLIIELFSTGCKGSKNEINYLEHVQAVISVQSNTRGTLVVTLRSPMGTNSTLLDRRMLDQSAEMFNKWPFTTVHMWGEKPQGTWILEIKNNAKNTTYINLNLILYGTKDSPHKRDVAETEDEFNHQQQRSKSPSVSSELKNFAMNNRASQRVENTVSSDDDESYTPSSKYSSPIASLSYLDQRNRKSKLSIAQTTNRTSNQRPYDHPNNRNSFGVDLSLDENSSRIRQGAVTGSLVHDDLILRYHQPKFKLIKSSQQPYHRITSVLTDSTKSTTTTSTTAPSTITKASAISFNEEQFSEFQEDYDHTSSSSSPTDEPVTNNHQDDEDEDEEDEEYEDQRVISFNRDEQPLSHERSSSFNDNQRPEQHHNHHQPPEPPQVAKKFESSKSFFPLSSSSSSSHHSRVSFLGLVSSLIVILSAPFLLIK